MNQNFVSFRNCAHLNRLFYIPIAFYFVLSSACLIAQNPTLVWAKTFGGSKQDYANSVVVTKDNKYLVPGLSWSSDGDIDSPHGLLSDVWLLKLDESGNILWKKNYGGSGGESMYSIAPTLDNGFIMVGATTSTDGDVTENKGESDCWVIKIDSIGKVQWQKTIGGSKDESLWSVFQTQNGDYIMGGYSNSNDKDFPQNAGKYDIWILKLDVRGNLVWKKSLGGSQDDLLSQLVNIDDKTFGIAARTDSEDGDMLGCLGDYSVKMDSSGKVVWKKSFGYPNEALGLKEFYGITMSQKNMVSVGMKIVNRSSPNLPYSWDFLITKSDTAGNRLWSKYFGGTETEKATSVQILPNSDLLIVGKAQSFDLDVKDNHGVIDFWVVRLDSFGNLKSANCYGGLKDDQAVASAVDKKGNLIVVGHSASSDGTFPQNKGAYDFAIIKLNYNITPTLEPSEELDVGVYPNPVEGELMLQIPPHSIPPIFRLHDITGTLMYQSKMDEKINAIDMHDFPQGFYVLSYQIGTAYHTKKILKM
jgi:Secretion system C-terminal sorting domain